VTANGLGANVVSRGEWALASRAGVPNDQITLEGVGKTTADLRAAARASADGRPLRWVALESPDEAEALADEVRRIAGPPLDVLYRLNPDVAPETLTGLAVGAGSTKFGMTETEIGAAISAGGGPDGLLRPRGIHLHVGSQLGAIDAWRDAVRKALALTALWRGSIVSFDTVYLGGGFPVGPTGDRYSTPCRRIAGRPDWPWSPAGRWSPVPAGSSPVSSTSGTEPVARSCSTPA
jgi:diaminopimelate decarboxylase